ncbi:MAG: ATP-dependent sacrificial sulfur transferase LarE [Planctomycetes bacterium]|nr:ATP-dependent sacrificial sulfur transferase LarE [Planctomycetota bacterium]
MDASGFDAKVAALRAELAGLERVAVAFSGGVDSSVLLAAALDALGPAPWAVDGKSAPPAGVWRGVAGVIADSASLPRRELAEARELARSIGAPLLVVATDELDDARYQANAGDRCYFCKSALFRAMRPWAEARGFQALAFGEITDDLLDDRPGARAAREFGVVAPLSRAGFTKEDVRALARRFGLSVAEKPASACLASRLPVGTRVTKERLARVEAGEERLRALGLVQLRLRDHGTHARVEAGAESLERALAAADRVAAELRPLGFETVEIARYRSPLERALGTTGGA